MNEEIIIESPKGLTFEEKHLYGFPAYLEIRRQGEKVGQFYFNMRGYNPDFDLLNAEGVHAGFGERSKTTQIRELRQFIREGFTRLRPFER